MGRKGERIAHCSNSIRLLHGVVRHTVALAGVKGQVDFFIFPGYAADLDNRASSAQFVLLNIELRDIGVDFDISVANGDAMVSRLSDDYLVLGAELQVDGRNDLDILSRRR